MPYAYQPLNHASGDIRLLSLPIGSNSIEDPNEPLRCCIEHVPSRLRFPFDEDQISESGNSPWEDYDALSYEWSIPEPRRIILLDGQPFEVTPNLYGALRRVQQTARKENRQWIKLWVDAICIDQSNVSERNIQVSRMRYIYSFASTVYCTLTPYSLTPNPTFEEWNNVPFDFEADMDNAGRMIPHLAKLPQAAQDAMIKSLESDYSNAMAAGWFVMIRFMSNSYWSRLWVVQEIALARQRVVVIAGRHSFEFEDISSIAWMMWNGMHTIAKLICRAYKRLPPSSWTHVAEIAWQRLNREERTEGPEDFDTVYMVLRKTMSSLCADPRDRVYGALGIISRDQSAKVSVDYSASVEQVYTCFAASVIEHTRSLTLLRLCSKTCTHEAKMPSWVPDLRTKFSTLLATENSASSRMNHLIQPRITSKSQLLLPGICIDHVDGLAATIDPQAQLDVVPVGNPGRLDHWYSNFDGLKVAFWSTLLCWEDQSATAPLPLTRAHLEVMCRMSPFARNLQKFFQVNKEFVIAGNAVESFFAEHDHSKSYLEHMQIWEDMLGQYIPLHRHHRMAFTTSGRLGLVPADTRKTDAIYALRGLKYLAVLRKHNDAWKFVGQCYVYGLMDGTSPDIVQRLEEAEQVTII